MDKGEWWRFAYGVLVLVVLCVVALMVLGFVLGAMAWLFLVGWHAAFALGG